MNQAFWRKWHRWIGFVAVPFLLYAGVTGVCAAVNEFFGEEEAQREQLRDKVSPVTLQSSSATHWTEPIGKVLAAAATKAGDAPVDKAVLDFKSDPPTIAIYTGKPTGGEDRKLVFDARSAVLLRDEAYVDKPFLVRLHSGEAWGDGGLVFAMFWGLALVVIGLSGIVIYFKMRRPNPSGLRRIFWLLPLGCALVGWPARATAQPPQGLDIHFIDTEGGAATLIVTPAGESVLIDTGNPGSRDAERIHQATTKAGLKQIDHLIITHWHIDHFGGVDRLSKLIPIKNFYDHGLPERLSEDQRFPTNILPYKQLTAGKARTLKPGDEVALQQTEGRPALRLHCICGSAQVIPDRPGAPENPHAKDHKPQPEDTSDNARSLGFVLSFGDFRFLDLGDLTWNVEYKLVHPTDKIGPVDVYQVTHHGLEVSNNPVLLQTVQPRVAICNNGPRKGGHVRVIADLRRVPGIQAIYQLHRNVTAGAAENTDPEFIANKDANCQGEGIRLSTAADGKSYTVTVGSAGQPRTYQTRR